MNKKCQLINVGDCHTGTALISALLIVALVAVVSFVFMARQHLVINEAIWSIRANDMQFALQGIQDWGVAQFQKARRKKQFNAAGFQLLPDEQHVGPINYHGMTLFGRIADQQALFNLNDVLRDVHQSLRFMRLLCVLDPSLSQTDAKEIIQSLKNYVTHHDPTGFLSDVSELRAVKGVTAVLYRRLSPYITVIPRVNNLPLNINTASAPLLMTINSAITAQKARELVACVKRVGVFNVIQAYKNLCVRPLGLPDLPHISTGSHYFVIVGQAHEGIQQQVRRRLIKIQTNSDLHNKRTQGLRAETLWQKMT